MYKGLEEYVEDRLNQWADWCARSCDHGLGYPKRSVEGRFMDEGGILTNRKGLWREPVHFSAEEIEQIVVEMSQYNQNLSKAIRFEYIEFGTQTKKARSLGMSLAQFKLNLKMAKAWLSGRLMPYVHKYQSMISQSQYT